jgi:hypothetical protein
LLELLSKKSVFNDITCGNMVCALIFSLTKSD